MGAERAGGSNDHGGGSMSSRNHSRFLFGSLAVAVSIASYAADIEQVEDLYVHTVAGTVDVAGGFLKGGANFDGGDAAFLMKWHVGDAGFSGHVRSWLDCRRNAADHDGSFSVHQMVTSWDESTDFGATIPVAGVDYNPNPVASIGFNNDDGPSAPNEDLADISAMVNYWIANPGNNHGLIFISRGQLNGSYPGSFGNEVLLPAQERVAGALDGDDTRITTFSAGDGPVAAVLEAIDDATVGECCKDAFHTKLGGNGGAGVENGDLKIPLYRFGFGAITMTSPLSNWDVTSATLELHTVNAANPATSFNVHRILVNWDEATVTWNQFGASGPQAGVHYKSASLGQITVGSGTASDTLDLTSSADFWIDNPGQNFGVILIPVVQTGTRDLGLSMSERVVGLDVDDTRLLVVASVQPTTPTLTPVTVPGAIVLEFLSIAGLDHQLERSADLSSPNWTPSGDPVSGTGGLLYIIDTDATPAAKSYRLRVQ